tara:strand:- start:11233 stop:12429 length:1197 start_codon:yes stop_codon:yes gene_type:complete
LGYPPFNFNKIKKKTIIFFLKEFIYLIYEFLKIFIFYVIFRINKKKILEKISNKKNLILENQTNLNLPFRKTTSRVVKNIFFDLNISFLSLKNIRLIIKENLFFCSFVALDFKNIFKSLIISLKVFYFDYSFDRNLLFNQTKPLRKIFLDTIKIYSLESFIEDYKVKKYFFFWENRGWQNHFLENYDKKFIGFQRGLEGELGPIYCNHRFNKNLNNSKIFFESKFHYLDFKGKNKILGSLNIKKKNKLELKLSNIKKNKILIFCGLDLANTNFALNLLKKFNYLYFRPHPELNNYVISQFNERLEIGEINDKFYNKFDAFISVGVCSFVSNLHNLNLNYLQLSNPHKKIDGFNLSRKKIISENDLSSYDYLIKKSKLKVNNIRFEITNKLIVRREILS